MKALVVGHFVEPPFSEGEVNVVLNWSKALQSVGASVKILSLNSKCSGNMKMSGVEFEYVRTTNPRFQNSLKDMFSLQARALSQNDFDIVHFASNVEGALSIPLLTFLKLEGFKIVNSYHVNNPTKSTFIFDNLIFDMVTLPSKRMYRHFLEHKISRNRMRLVPPCVDENFFCPRDKLRAREKLGISCDSFVLFTTGHFKPGRLIIPLIGQIQELSSSGKNITLIVGWTGHGEEECIREIFSLAHENKSIRIVPPTNLVNLYYNASDLYVLSAQSDSVIETPLSLIESMSSGTPALGFDVNASSEIIRNGVNGFLFRSGDFGGIGSAINQLMSNPRILAELSQNARKYALQNNSYAKVGRQLLDLLKEIVD
jgi:glycosyltransferase involved in cell wall biosynthesis